MAVLHFKHPKTVSIGAVPVTGVTDMTINKGGDELDFSSDTDDHIVWTAATKKQETIDLTVSDLKATLITFPTGTEGAFSAKVATADAGGADLTYSCTTVRVRFPKAAAPHAALGSGTISLKTLAALTCA